MTLPFGDDDLERDLDVTTLCFLDDPDALFILDGDLDLDICVAFLFGDGDLEGDSPRMRFRTRSTRALLVFFCGISL